MKTKFLIILHLIAIMIGSLWIIFTDDFWEPLLIFTLAFFELIYLIYHLFRNRNDTKYITSKRNREKYKFECRPVKNLKELKWLYNKFIECFGPNIMPYNQLKHIYDKNKKTIWFVVKSPIDHCDKEIITGYFELFPIKKRYTKKIRKKSLDTLSITHKMISEHFRKASTFYIASIGSFNVDNRFENGAIVNEIKSMMENISMDKDSVFLARPVSDYGINLLNRFDFQKLYPISEDIRTLWEKKIVNN